MVILLMVELSPASHDIQLRSTAGRGADTIYGTPERALSCEQPGSDERTRYSHTPSPKGVG